MATQRRTQQHEGNGEEGASAAASLPNPANMVNMAGMAEVARQQMLFASHALGVLFRSTEAIYRANMQAGERAALLHGQATENIRKAGTAAELMSVQVTLAVYQGQEATRYWQEVGAAVMGMGSEMMRSVPGASAVAGASATAEDGRAAGGPAVQQATTAATAMMDAAMSAAAPMADALQQMFTAPLRPAAASPRQH